MLGVILVTASMSYTWYHYLIQDNWNKPEEHSRNGLNAWWRHQMKTFSALLALCAGNPPVTGEFTAQRPVTRSFGVFFDLRLNKPLRKHWNTREAGYLRRHRAHDDVIIIGYTTPATALHTTPQSTSLPSAEPPAKWLRPSMWHVYDKASLDLLWWCVSWYQTVKQGLGLSTNTRTN